MVRLRTRAYLQMYGFSTAGTPTSDLVPPLVRAISPMEITKLPPLRFGGRIVVVNVAEEEQRIQSVFQNESVIGFDTESLPSTAFGPKNKIALVQLATEHVAVLWRISELRCVPPVLTEILQDPSRHKVGQGAVHEVEALKKWNVSAQSFVDLHHIALHLRTHPRSLQGLVALFLKTRLMKEQRLTNWEQSPLTRAQMEYAAADAWASRQVLIAIRRAYFVDRLACERLHGASSFKVRSDCEKNMNEVEPAHSAADSQQPSHGALQRLQALCVRRGYVLRSDGFEPAAQGFRSVFRVERRHLGRATEAFRSKRVHATIRAAQNDAASEALRVLESHDDDPSK